MFHSHLQYSLLNWGRACKSHYHKLVILQSNILRACLFRPLHHPTNSLYSDCSVSKLEDTTKMEFAKFMFKFNNNMLPTFFNNYFLKLDKVHNYNTGQKLARIFPIFCLFGDREKDASSHLSKVMERYSSNAQALFFFHV